MRKRHVAGMLMALVLLAATTSAQDTLARAKDLYLSADYDQALALLEQLTSQPASAAVTEVEQYRVFCLLALNRSDEAHKAIEHIVTADPFYRPSETLMSPRIRSVFEQTRKAILPALVQRTYADAKASFEKKDPKAIAQFEQVLALLDDPDLKGSSQLGDLRTVATGFRDLSKALADTAPKPPALSPPPRVQAPVQPPAEAAQAPPAAVVEAPPGPANDGSPGYTPPIVISQPLPLWKPPSSADRRTAFKGSIEVSIDEKGNVTGATIQQSVHPAYDEKLLAIARTWKYKPAMRYGVPTTSVKVVAIQLQPAR